MDPYLKGGQIIIEDQKTASTLRNKGSFGTAGNNKEMVLDLMEGAYLLENGRLILRSSAKGRKMTFGTLLSLAVEEKKGFLPRFLVYRDLRNRGLIVHHAGGEDFTVYPRGGRPGGSGAEFWLRVFREDDQFTYRSLLIEARRRGDIRLRPLSAVVDSDWDITYYELKTEMDFMPPNLRREAPAISGDVALTGMEEGGSILWDGEKKRLHELYMIGTPLGDSLLLSREEERALTGNSEDVRNSTLVYRDLVGRGFYVRTGFKYGSDFRVYTEDPEKRHSSMLVHCASPDDTTTWMDLARSIRLCHSVNKRMVYGTVLTGGRKKTETVEYLNLEWVRL